MQKAGIGTSQGNYCMFLPLHEHHKRMQHLQHAGEESC